MSENSNLKNLIEMGFDESKASKALQVNNNNIQEAMEWLLIHSNDLETPSQSGESTSASAENVVQPTLVLNTEKKEEEENQKEGAHSLKCDDCGKLLKDADAATAHAYKTSHSNFSESIESIKPKTKEEIEQQKKDLDEKLKKLRADKEEQARKDEIEREKQRRTSGRQIHEIRQKVQETEMKRLAEEKRREKKEAEAHKQKVRDQIAEDRAAFKKANQQEQSSAPQLTASPPAAAPVTVEKRSYDECKIQIRLTNGQVMQQTFKSKEPLAAVRLWIEMNRTDDNGKFNLIQTFPRKQYNDDDMMRSLEDLGLVPASSLVITK